MDIEEARSRLVDGKISSADFFKIMADSQARARAERDAKERRELERQDAERLERKRVKADEIVACVNAIMSEIVSERILEALVFIDSELYERFKRQRDAYNEAIQDGDVDGIVCVGEAMLRGCKMIRIGALRLHPGNPPISRGGDRARQFRERQSEGFRKWYDLYLASEDWQLKREKVMKRANFKCEGCGDADATQVHHRSYDNVGYEFLFELVAVCRECHERIHGR